MTFLANLAAGTLVLSASWLSTRVFPENLSHMSLRGPRVPCFEKLYVELLEPNGHAFFFQDMRLCSA